MELRRFHELAYSMRQSAAETFRARPEVAYLTVLDTFKAFSLSRQYQYPVPEIIHLVMPEKPLVMDDDIIEAAYHCNIKPKDLLYATNGSHDYVSRKYWALKKLGAKRLSVEELVEYADASHI